jgi:hypothetical protein
MAQRQQQRPARLPAGPPYSGTWSNNSSAQIGEQGFPPNPGGYPPPWYNRGPRW